MVSGRTVAPDSHDGAGARGREPRQGARLQCVEVMPAEGETEDLLDSGGDILEVAVAVELVDVFVASGVHRVEQAQVGDHEGPTEGERRRDDVANDGRDVDHPADRAVRRHPVELAVVGVHRIQGSVDRDHAVPGPVGLEVLLVGVGDRIRLDERAEIGDERPRPVAVDLEDPVGHGGHPVRASRAPEQAIEAMADKGDAGDAGDQVAEGRGRLARGQRIDDRRDVAARVDLRDPAAAHGVVGAAGVRSGRARRLGAPTDRRVGAAEAALGDVEVPVGTKDQSARVVEPGREGGDDRWGWLPPVTVAA